MNIIKEIVIHEVMANCGIDWGEAVEEVAKAVHDHGELMGLLRWSIVAENLRTIGYDIYKRDFARSYDEGYGYNKRTEAVRSLLQYVLAPDVPLNLDDFT
jgi:hypothetical protein